MQVRDIVEASQYRIEISTTPSTASPRQQPIGKYSIEKLSRVSGKGLPQPIAACHIQAGCHDSYPVVYLVVELQWPSLCDHNIPLKLLAVDIHLRRTPETDVFETWAHHDCERRARSGVRMRHRT